MASNFKQNKEFYTHMLLLQQEALISFFVSSYGLPEAKEDSSDEVKQIIDEVNATFKQCAMLSNQLGMDKIRKKYYGANSEETVVENEAVS